MFTRVTTVVSLAKFTHFGLCLPLAVGLLFVAASSAPAPVQADHPPEIQATLRRSGDNRAQLETALQKVPAAQRVGLEFLISHMPDHDATSLTAEFLLENVDYAYRAWRESPWKDKVPEAEFLNNVLPYASINERRDNWRKDFFERFRPLVADARTPGHAAALLNQKLFSTVNVRYSTARRKADQSPYESLQSGLASCSGLSVLLIDACRAVGVPARFVGTPLWSDNSGNHSWVEVWDDGWHFTGAAEPAGDKLDAAWFIDRASQAKRDEPRHAIYAVSFRQTPLRFPLVWDPRIDYVSAVNVTDRYAGKAAATPAGHRSIRIRTFAGESSQRCAAQITVRDSDGKSVFAGTSKDERFDANDHVVVALREGATYEIEASREGRQVRQSVTVGKDDQLVTLRIEANSPETKNTRETTAPQNKQSDKPAAPTTGVLKELDEYLAREAKDRPALTSQAFAQKPLSKTEADEAEKRLWADHVQRIKTERADELKQKVLKLGELEMPFEYKLFGDAPADGRSLFISMHGGGGAPKAVNDQQWENQKRLYKLSEGVYVAPRAPTNTWDLWHQSHIDAFFDRLIENLVVFEGVNPDRVYLMGYSAGGDGVFQVAPRMADRFAAAAMMAGHPNETSPLGLRNLPFTIHMGGKDAAYNRNQVARQWGEQLAKLREADPKGYEHWVKIYDDKGHWLDREDASAIPWMAKFTRQPFPSRVVWKQDDVLEPRFYWLGAPEDQRKARSEVTAQAEGQTIQVQATEVQRISIRLHDRLVDLDEPVQITSAGQTLFSGRVPRTIAAIATSLAERGDPRSVYRSEVTVTLGKSE